MNDTERHVAEHVAEAAIIGIGGWAIVRWCKAFVTWWQRPSERTLMRQAIEGINGTLKGIDANMVRIIDQQAIQFAASEITFSESNRARWMCNDKGECVMANRKLQELFGLTAEEMKGYGWMDAIDPSQRERVSQEFKRLYHDQDFNYESTYPIRREGKLHSITAKAVKVVRAAGSPNGHVIAVYGTCEPFQHLIAA